MRMQDTHSERGREKRVELRQYPEWDSIESFDVDDLWDDRFYVPPAASPSATAHCRRRMPGRAGRAHRSGLLVAVRGRAGSLCIGWGMRWRHAVVVRLPPLHA